MTPADLIKPFLVEADRRKPHLKIDNRFASCFELLEDTLALAGPDWAFIGKTRTMDGASVAPAWFTERGLSLVRPDGQMQSVVITGLGMDAAWYLPTMRQVKVIANSTANEPGEHQHGPAHLNPYDIAAENYRWHNPPIPQRDGIVVTPMPSPHPAPPAPSSTLPGREEMQDAGRWLDAYYSSFEGLKREQGLSIGGRPDWEGVGAWLFDVYLKARLGGQLVSQARALVISEIRKAGGPTGEWSQKHPGETP